jgi:plasmid stabilization system protein ParE
MYAQLNADSIVKSVERLQRFPESGRDLIAGNYRVVYRYDSNSNKVKIITVVHGSRLLTETFFTE